MLSIVICARTECKTTRTVASFSHTSAGNHFCYLDVSRRRDVLQHHIDSRAMVVPYGYGIQIQMAAGLVRNCLFWWVKML